MINGSWIGLELQYTKALRGVVVEETPTHVLLRLQNTVNITTLKSGFKPEDVLTDAGKVSAPKSLFKQDEIIKLPNGSTLKHEDVAEEKEFNMLGQMQRAHAQEQQPEPVKEIKKEEPKPQFVQTSLF